MPRAYALLCRVFGVVLVLFGLQLVLTFVRSLAPGAPPPLPFPIGPNGLYFVAFAGCSLVAWGGCLFGAARASGGPDPSLARAAGTATAIALVLHAVYRPSTSRAGRFGSRTSAVTASCSPSSAASTGDPTPRRGSWSCGRRWSRCRTYRSCTWWRAGT
jgi:hypothetical protein